MDYPTLVKPQPATPVAPTYKDQLREWVTSDCRNKECIDGTMSIPSSDGQYSTLYRCPICTRANVATREYEGPIERWTDEEMAARLKDRKDIYFDKSYRYKRGMEVMSLLKSIAIGGR